MDSLERFKPKDIPHPLLKLFLLFLFCGIFFRSLDALQYTVTIQFDDRLEKMVYAMVPDIKLVQPKGLDIRFFAPILRTFISEPQIIMGLEKPDSGTNQATYRQGYFQLVSQFDALLPPVDLNKPETLAPLKDLEIYTSETMAFAALLRLFPKIQLVGNHQNVIQKINEGGVGVLRLDQVHPRHRGISPVFPVQFWVEWKPNENGFLNKFAINYRLTQAIENLLGNSVRELRPQLTEIIAVGNIVIGGGMGKKALELRKENQGSLYPFEKIHSKVAGPAISMGNLASVISDMGSPHRPSKVSSNIVPIMKEAGFTVMDLGNDHTMDYGSRSIEHTIQNLKKNGIQIVGGGYNHLEAAKPLILKMKDGSSVGILAYTTLVPLGYAPTMHQSGVNPYKESRVKNEIQDLRKKVDALIVQIHWGDDHARVPSSNQKKMARQAIDLGADLVLGHHPQYVQQVEWYKNKFIAYSLGNFVTEDVKGGRPGEGLMIYALFKNQSLKQIGIDPVLIINGEPHMVPWEIPMEGKTGKEILRRVLSLDGGAGN